MVAEWTHSRGFKRVVSVLMWQIFLPIGTKHIPLVAWSSYIVCYYSNSSWMQSSIIWLKRNLSVQAEVSWIQLDFTSNLHCPPRWAPPCIISLVLLRWSSDASEVEMEALARTELKPTHEQDELDLKSASSLSFSRFMTWLVDGCCDSAPDPGRASVGQLATVGFAHNSQN